MCDWLRSAKGKKYSTIMEETLIVHMSKTLKVDQKNVKEDFDNWDYEMKFGKLQCINPKM